MFSSRERDVAAAGASRLSGRLGVVSIMFMVVAAAAPLQTVAAIVPIAMVNGNGEGYPFSYLAVAAILALFVVGFGLMTRFIKEPGAFYTYVTEGLGRGPGVGTAFAALITYICVQTAVLAFLGVAVRDFLIGYGGPNIPWAVWTAVFILIIGILGYRHIDVSGKVLGILLIVEFALLATIVIVTVATNGGPQGNLTTVTPTDFVSGSPALGVLFAFTGFLGFEGTAVYRDEARDPSRTIPRATYGALVLIGLGYALSSWAVISVWGGDAMDEASQNPGTMVTAAFQMVLGGWSSQLVQFFIITSAIACVLSFQNLIARYVFTLANSGVLPRGLGKVHPRHSSPYIASATLTVILLAVLAVILLVGLDPLGQVLSWFSGLGGVGFILLLTLTCASVVVFFRSRPDLVASRMKSLVIPSVAGVLIAACLVLTIVNTPTLIGSWTVAFCAVGALAAVFVGGWLLAVLRPNINAQHSAVDSESLVDGSADRD